MAPPPLSAGAVVGGFGAPPPTGTPVAPATAPEVARDGAARAGIAAAAFTAALAAAAALATRRRQKHTCGERGEGAVVSACMQGSSSEARHVLHEASW